MPLIIHSVSLLLIVRDVVFSLVFGQSLIGLGHEPRKKRLLNLVWLHLAIVRMLDI